MTNASTLKREAVLVAIALTLWGLLVAVAAALSEPGSPHLTLWLAFIPGLWLMFKSTQWLIVAVQYFTGFQLTFFNWGFLFVLFIGAALSMFILPAGIIINLLRYQRLKQQVAS